MARIGGMRSRTVFMRKTKSLIVEFEILIAEIRFTLIAVDVENQEVFDFLKTLATVLYRARNYGPEYDGVKSLLDFMWSVFTGWSFIEGYIKKGRDRRHDQGDVNYRRSEV